MHIVIIGGGVQGLCTAEYLSQSKGIQITVIEQFSRLHQRGSSHGLSRITRSAYSDSLYVSLMQQCHNELWPALEKRLGVQIIHPVTGCFLGPEEGLFQEYAAAVLEAGANVRRLSVSEARQTFPQFNIEDGDGVLLDATSGIVHAEKLLQALWQRLDFMRVHCLTNTKVEKIEHQGSSILIGTDKGIIQADKLIVCAGAWSGQLFPELLSPTINVVRQTVSYWRLKDPRQGCSSSFPVWVELGIDKREVWYGLPAIDTEGIKIARHQLLGSDDPDDIIEKGSEQQHQEIREWLSKRMSLEIEGLQREETCLYSVTEDEDFIIDHHPETDQVLMGAGFSGHGFKFAPMVGRILAERALMGTSTLELWERNRQRFSLLL